MLPIRLPNNVPPAYRCTRYHPPRTGFCSRETAGGAAYRRRHLSNTMHPAGRWCRGRSHWALEPSRLTVYETVEQPGELCNRPGTIHPGQDAQCRSSEQSGKGLGGARLSLDLARTAALDQIRFGSFRRLRDTGGCAAIPTSPAPDLSGDAPDERGPLGRQPRVARERHEHCRSCSTPSCRAPACAATPPSKKQALGRIDLSAADLRRGRPELARDFRPPASRTSRLDAANLSDGNARTRRPARQLRRGPGSAPT